MITFVVKGSKARTAPDFLLKDLPGSGGRMDLLCRCLTSSLLLSHGIRTDVEVVLCLAGPPSPPRTITVRGDAVRHLSPDERSTAILLQKALAAYRAGETVESTPGITISDIPFAEVVARNAKRLVVLDEGGADIRDVEHVPADACFVLGDHLGFTDEEQALLADAPLTVTVSPKVLHASQCISLVLNECDRRGII